VSKPTNYLTDRDVAEHFGISWQQVQERCKSKQWPHIRLGRFYRFTEKHVEQIERLHEVGVAAPEAQEQTWGRKTRGTKAS